MAFFGCVPVAGFLPSPSSNGLHIGPLFIHAYGLAYVVAVTAAVAITSRRWKAHAGDAELVREVALWGFPAGLIGGRLYFVATSWNEVPRHWWGPFAIWQGGLGVWGGIALGTLVGLLTRTGVLDYLALHRTPARAAASERPRADRRRPLRPVA